MIPSYEERKRKKKKMAGTDLLKYIFHTDDNDCNINYNNVDDSQ